MMNKHTHSSRIRGLSVLGLLLFCLGCSEVYLSNPLDSIRADQIAGRWADESGKIFLVIERGSGNIYNSWSPDDYSAGKPPTPFFVAEAGGMLFTEQHVDCAGHRFKAPEEKESPKGCWSLTRIVLSNTTLDYYDLDAMTLVRQSVAGAIHIAHSYGVSATKNDRSPSAEMLLEGTSGELSSFLAGAGQEAIYLAPKKLHRV